MHTIFNVLIMSKQTTAHSFSILQKLFKASLTLGATSKVSVGCECSKTISDF